MAREIKIAEPTDPLYPGAENHVCVLREVKGCDLRMPYQFMAHLEDVFGHLSQHSIVGDLLNNAVGRTSLCYRPENMLTTMTSANSTAVLVAILLRPNMKIRPDHGKAHAMREATRAEREALLILLHYYGVKCTTGECCGLVTDPIQPGQTKPKASAA